MDDEDTPKTHAKGTTYKEIEEENHMKRLLSPNLLHFLTCFTASNETVNISRFDSDSFIIAVEKNASKTIYNQRYHFVGKFLPLTHQHIKDISGKITIKGQGTFIWKIEDDEGRVHTLEINGVLYIPESPLSIL